MNSAGHLIDMQNVSIEEASKKFNEGYRPVKKQFLGSAGMMLRGRKETRVDPQLHPLWCLNAKQKKKRIARAMKKK